MRFNQEYTGKVFPDRIEEVKSWEPQGLTTMWKNLIYCYNWVVSKKTKKRRETEREQILWKTSADFCKDVWLGCNYNLLYIKIERKLKLSSALYNHVRPKWHLSWYSRLKKNLIKENIEFSQEWAEGYRKIICAI